MTKEDVLDFFFKTVEDVIGCVTLPTGDSLIPTFIYSLVITVASAISEFAFHWSFFDFRGALIATVLLLGLAMVRCLRGTSRKARTATTPTRAVPHSLVTREIRSLLRRQLPRLRTI